VTREPDILRADKKYELSGACPPIKFSISQAVALRPRGILGAETKKCSGSK
jgi:hypothetical protein